MAREADFYTAEETAKVLGLPIRRIFGMLCSGELEGHQDEWARWLVPASAVQEARQSLGPSGPSGVSESGAESHAAAEAETRVWDAAETAVLSGDGPLLGPPCVTDPSGGEETTQEADEAPLDGSSTAPRARTGSDDAETTEKPPFDKRPGAAADADPDETIREITERLAAAAARTRELRRRLELAEATEVALRESLERERRGAEREGARAEQHGSADEHPQEESAAWRSEGFWRGLFGG